MLNRFIDFLGAAKSKCNLASLQPDDIAQFRDREAKELSRSTANLSVKVLRVCLGEAERQGLITSNPAKKVKTLESTRESKRRPFTVAEIKRILATRDTEWRGLVLFGLYLGQRLGDLARLTWRSVNFETDEIAFMAKKTGRRIVLPLMQTHIDYLSSLPSSDNPNAHIFPNAAKHKRTASMSNQFREILVEAGLAEARDYRVTTKGRASARESSEISFHSLWHSAVTMLKASGLSDVFRPRDRRSRERSGIASLHALEHGRSAQRDATLAGRDECRHLKTRGQSLDPVGLHRQNASSDERSRRSAQSCR